MPQGQAIWETAGTGSKDYIVVPETSKNMSYEFRHRSAVGKLSKAVKTKTVGSGREEREIDIGESAVTWSKEITKGDEVRFTLEQQMRGTPTFGDAKVGMGDYLAYLHANVVVNKLDTPAVPLPEDMSRQRVAEVISDPKSQTRNAITMYLAEQYVLDFYEGFLRGGSRNLMATKLDGGRALDLGLGAGVQVSPENFIVAGDGFVSGTSGTAGYETAAVTALGTLTDTAGDYITREFIHNLRYALVQRKIAPVNSDGRDVYYAACDPLLLARLTQPGATLYQAWLQAQERSKSNPAFGHATLELDDILFFPDYWLRKFRPDISAGTLVWGQAGIDKRDFEPTSSLALMSVFGNGSMLEAHNGSVDLTYEPGFHGKGMSLAGHIKQSFMRTRYIPKDGRTGVVLNQASLLCAFYEPGLTL